VIAGLAAKLRGSDNNVELFGWQLQRFLGRPNAEVGSIVGSSFSSTSLNPS